MEPTEIRRTVRLKLLEADIPLIDVSRLCGLDYNRAQRVIHGYAAPRPGEVESILQAIEDATRTRRPQAEA